MSKDILPTDGGMVCGLRVLPHGPTYRFDDFRVDGQAKDRLLMGKGVACDIPITGDAASAVHCFIDRRDPMRVTVQDCESEAGTWLNGARMKEGELRAGTLLSVGDMTFVAVGGKGSSDRVLMAATTMHEFLTQALITYGSVRRAAEAIGIPRSTLQSWVRGKKFERALPAASGPARGAGGESA